MLGHLYANSFMTIKFFSLFTTFIGYLDDTHILISVSISMKEKTKVNK